MSFGNSEYMQMGWDCENIQEAVFFSCRLTSLPVHLILLPSITMHKLKEGFVSLLLNFCVMTRRFDLTLHHFSLCSTNYYNNRDP